MTEKSDEGASQLVYRGVLHALETGAVSPGQRLIESELAAHFGVGRNAIREAMQKLAARGVVDLQRNRSASIRQMDEGEVQEVLDVSGTIIELLFASAARHFDAASDKADLDAALAALEAAYADGDEVGFSRARRAYYRLMLRIANNRELVRIFPAIGTHIMNAKYQSRHMQTIRMTAYRAIAQAVAECDPRLAKSLAEQHNDDMRDAVRERAKVVDGAGFRRPG
jgi:DNA-binding GntR family transcriptional regulator